MGKTPIAREEIEIPENVEVTLNGKVVTIRGPKGEITKDFSHTIVNIKSSDNKIIVEYIFPRK
ncbi:MAG: 50S ribosomal protein L6, partial [Candidatus Asgardarchaeia archaeon]